VPFADLLLMQPHLQQFQFFLVVGVLDGIRHARRDRALRFEPFLRGEEIRDTSVLLGSLRR
jgi:hypothetical protein